MALQAIIEFGDKGCFGEVRLFPATVVVQRRSGGVPSGPLYMFEVVGGDGSFSGGGGGKGE